MMARRRLMIIRSALGLVVTGAGIMIGTTASASDFALSVSPPRFELSIEPGKTVRSVVELTNASNAATQLDFSTAEWDLTADGGVTTAKALKANSCRQWVAIERRSATLSAKSSLHYRFEVTPPIGTPPTECRFAILVSGGEEKVSPTKDTSFPIAAQVAVIVYVKVGDVKPQIRILKATVTKLNGMLVPALIVKNAGTAHGRISAFLHGQDAKGKKREFAASTLPILPGETRTIPLSVDHGEDAVASSQQSQSAEMEADTIAYPLKVSGTISDTVNSFRFDGLFEL